MLKRLTSLMLAFAFMLGIVTQVYAVEAGEQRVAVGGNLTSEQKVTVYDYFGINQGDVDEIAVTIDDEKKYLESVDSSRIGSKSISSIYIITKEEGEGLDISLYNINWLTKEIYENALITSGITDARVTIAAPFDVSGTAALTGIYKAYEDITGETLDEESKQAATEELVTTGELADDIGSEEAAALVNELKKELSNLQDMSDEEVKTEINNIAINMNINLTTDQISQLLKLVRSLENIDFDKLTSALESVSGKLGDIVNDPGFWDSVKSFFGKIVDFISSLFS